MKENPMPDYADSAASPWVVRWAHLVSPAMEVLDLACGHGRHARLFARRGCRVAAVDRDAAALATLTDVPGTQRILFDLEQGAWPFPGKRFDAVVVVRYLHRPLLPLILDAVAEHGVLIYETFMHGNERYGRPSSPAFLLAPGELLDWVQGRLRVVAFEQGRMEGERASVVQRICAVGPAFGEPLL
jgi:SAM-dependent methyltransferase